MKHIFVDSSALVALEYEKDRYHREAVRLSQVIQQGKIQMVISNHIFAEAISIVRNKVGFEQAFLLGNRVFNSKITTLIIADEKVLNNAWGIFSRYNDKDFGFVDCISFAIMEQEEIDIAFTFDRHFEQMGFKIL